MGLVPPHSVLDFRTKDRRFWCCSICVSGSSCFQSPFAKISTQASCTFCQPWNRPRWLMAPILPGHMWWMSWKSISFHRWLPPKQKAMKRCKKGQVRSGSEARNSFHQCEWLMLVKKVQAREKPVRNMADTMRVNFQPSERGNPRPTEPRSQTQAQQDSTKRLCLTRAGSHLVQKALSHLPLGQASGKFIHHKMAKRPPVSLAPTKCHSGTKGTVNQPYHAGVHSCKT
mmetsp:Transcript_57705/g.126431  ORF Transcript_57705/g.126431 Transcript_57705/m.126431 type:complete len:228 (-) Transcript_57705:833-1516(-)